MRKDDLPLVSTVILVISTISLIVETTAFALLFFSYSRKRVRKYRQHGIIMGIAVLMHLVVIISWMIVSLIMYFTAVQLNLGNILQVATVFHVGFGTFAALSGVWLVGSWRFKADIQKCFNRKRWMLSTIVIWSVAFFLGTYFYAVLISS